MYDVIIPLKSTNQLIIENVSAISYFKEVKNIYIGDSGISSEIIKCLSSINKVIIVDQKKIFSQGYCIIDLIKHVQTDFFAYLHGDVTLPSDWFTLMRQNIGRSTFAECGRIHLYDIKYEERLLSRTFPKHRPLSGAQFGKTDLFLSAVSKVDDDFLFRNEDLVFADLVKQNGGDYKIINQTHHYHQLGNNRVNENIKARMVLKTWSIPTIDDLWLFRCQIEGILKYTKNKDKYLIDNLMYALTVLKFLKDDEYIGKILKNPCYKKWHLIIRMHPAYCLRLRIKNIIKMAIRSNLNLYND